MLRILFCISCCGVPPSRRPVRGKATVAKTNEKLVEEANFKSLIHTDSDERDRLLENQIQANNDNYGAKESSSQGKLTSAASDQQTNSAEDYINDRQLSDDESISAPSSIDVEAFRENPTDTGPEQDENLDLRGESMQPSELGGGSSVGTIERIAANDVPSTSKIGDYARIEYSPVEDLDSVTTMSQSRGGSERGGRHVSGAPSIASRQTSSKPPSEAVSRRSSQGVESTSISIASQLSNEQLHQNLTEMIESANSPVPIFGTIGLPLGPPLEMFSETAKTSPETTGAALTSASQDSLSDPSLVSPPISRSATMGSTATSGAALIDTNDRGYAEESTELTRSAPAAESTRTNEILLTDRVGSPQSIATTTSGGITSATPTPSELSGGSLKKKSKLKPGALLKRLRPGGKKKNKDTENKS